jgi:hypothetical protein
MSTSTRISLNLADTIADYLKMSARGMVGATLESEPGYIPLRAALSSRIVRKSGRTASEVLSAIDELLQRIYVKVQAEHGTYNVSSVIAHADLIADDLRKPGTVTD